jgi:hemerythrin-like domain-containing protein
MMGERLGRRGFIAVAGAALLAPGRARASVGVPPGEDLMQEHGVLRRAMLVYDEAVRRLGAREPLPLDRVGAAATLIRRVIQDCHEKLEEEFVFPRMERAGKLTSLVATLRDQHRAGRAVTAAIAKLTGSPLRDEADRRRLGQQLSAFNRMYRPHAAREDTVLFPAFQLLLGDKEYRALGEQFEEVEERVLGPGGFEKAVDEVAAIEAALGIHDLARFTP